MFMKKKEKKSACAKTYIGGQAVMEGVMMRGKRAMVTAVRDPEGKIQIESERLTPPEKAKKITNDTIKSGMITELPREAPCLTLMQNKHKGILAKPISP